jgi:hypothetical protein
MEQSPSWEANQFAASQEFPRILWNQKVHTGLQLAKKFPAFYGTKGLITAFTSARHLSLS